DPLAGFIKSSDLGKGRRDASRIDVIHVIADLISHYAGRLAVAAGLFVALIAKARPYNELDRLRRSVYRNANVGVKNKIAAGKREGLTDHGFRRRIFKAYLALLALIQVDLGLIGVQAINLDPEIGVVQLSRQLWFPRQPDPKRLDEVVHILGYQ